MNLSDLTAERWTPVARRVRTDQWDEWLWDLPLHERGAFHMEKSAGNILTAQQRDAETGQFRLLARLCAPKRVRVVRWGGKSKPPSTAVSEPVSEPVYESDYEPRPGFLD